MKKQKMNWMPYEAPECPKCDCIEALVYTKSKKEGLIYDGEEAKCFNCGYKGYVSVEDSECADIIWDSDEEDEDDLIGAVIAFRKRNPETTNRITYDQVLELGWNDRHPNSDRTKDLLANKTFVFPSEEGNDYHIMGIYKYSDDEDIYLTQIKCVPESTDHNEWENSECHFYGYLQTIYELKVVMRQLEIGTDCYGNPEPYEKTNI